MAAVPGRLPPRVRKPPRQRLELRCASLHRVYSRGYSWLLLFFFFSVYGSVCFVCLQSESTLIKYFCVCMYVCKCVCVCVYCAVSVECCGSDGCRGIESRAFQYRGYPLLLLFFFFFLLTCFGRTRTASFVVVCL